MGMSKPKVDKEAERAREAEKKLQAKAKADLEANQMRLDDQRKRRGAGLGAFTRTGDLGILSQVLGG
jgi:hypothetical protein